jgi:molecular chaperone DnaK (HSP70)
LAAPVKKKATEDRFIAIDFGTQASRVIGWRGEKAVVVADATAETEIPAVLLLAPDGGTMAGTEARAWQTLFPRETLLGPKTLLTADPQALEARGPFFPHPIAVGPGKLAQLEMGGRSRTAVELVALYLAYLHRQAEIALEHPVSGAVITVPVSFSPFDRQALRVAARLAGFQRLRLIDEPIAAALAALARGVRGRIATCVWGAAHFGAAIVELQDEVVRVVSAVGSDRVGGEQLELALAKDLLARVRQEMSGSLENEIHVCRYLLTQAQRLVREIAAGGKAEVALRLPGREKPWRHTLTAVDLEASLAPLRETVAGLCERLLADARLSRSDLDALLLAGGMARLPAAAQHVETLFARRPLEGIDPLDAAAQGALVRARYLEHELPGPLVLDALPASLGLQGQGGQTLVLLDRGETVPASRTELFTTYLERQTEVGVALFAHRGLRWEPLARVEISRLPVLKEGQAQIEVTFALDEDAVLSVEAREVTKSKALGVDVRPDRGLSSSQASLLVSELPPPEDGGFPERLCEALRERGRLLLGTVRTAAQNHPSSMTRDEKQLITSKTRDLEETLESHDPGELRSAIRELSEAAQPLLHRVLDKQVEALLR